MRRKPEKGKRGRKRFYAHLSDADQQKLFDTTASKLELHSPHSELKRQDGLQYVWGVSMPSLLAYLDKSIPDIMAEIRKVHRRFGPKSLRHLFIAPNKGRRAKKRYWGIIQAKVARGQNDLHEFHPHVRGVSSSMLLLLGACPQRECSCHARAFHMVRRRDHVRRQQSSPLLRLFDPALSPN